MDLDSIPPLTGLWALSSLALSLLEHTHLISSFSLFYTPNLAFSRLQLWRFLTTFLYFGPLSLDFIFHLFFFMRYSRMLEEERPRKADFLWMLLVCGAMLLLISPAVGMPFLGSPLAFVLTYIWSRKNRHVQMSLFGIIVVAAPWTPWALAAVGGVLNGSLKAVMGDLVGIAVGHVYYFLVDVWPREEGASNWLATPSILSRIVDGTP